MHKENALHIAGVDYESVVDGEGVRAAIFLSGCSHNCPFCHNKDAQNPNYGIEITEEVILEIADQINKRPFLSGITLTGGDPLYYPDQAYYFLVELLSIIDRRDYMTVWMYTGSLYEECKDMRISTIVDVIVDGEFLIDHADKKLSFRGSNNQRIIDVKRSLFSGTISLLNMECEK